MELYLCHYKSSLSCATPGLEFDNKSQAPDTAFSSHETVHQIKLTDWIDWSQALALALASVGFALLILGMFPSNSDSRKQSKFSMGNQKERKL
jgi:hypothetical protein